MLNLWGFFFETILEDSMIVMLNSERIDHAQCWIPGLQLRILSLTGADPVAGVRAPLPLDPRFWGAKIEHYLKLIELQSNALIFISFWCWSKYKKLEKKGL